MKNNSSKTQELSKSSRSLPNSIKTIKSKMRKSITAAVRKMQEEAEPIKKHTSSYIKNNPYKALGFAVLATFLLSKLM